MTSLHQVQLGFMVVVSSLKGRAAMGSHWGSVVPGQDVATMEAAHMEMVARDP